VRVKSATLVTRIGLPSGPLLVRPTSPAVLVLTPSIALPRYEVSWM
jgi:hypothetical protein